MEAVCVCVSFLWELPVCKQNTLLIRIVDNNKEGDTSNENVNKEDRPRKQDINTKGNPELIR